MNAPTTTIQILRASRVASITAIGALCLVGVPCSFAFGAGLPAVAYFAGSLGKAQATAAFGAAGRSWPMGLLVGLGTLAYAALVMLAEPSATHAVPLAVTVGGVTLATLALAPLLSIAAAALDPARPRGAMPTLRAGLRDARAAGWRHRLVVLAFVLALVIGPVLATSWWVQVSPSEGPALLVSALVMLAGPSLATPILIAHALAARARCRDDLVEHSPETASPRLLRVSVGIALVSAILGAAGVGLALLVPLPTEMLPPYEAIVHPTREAPYAVPGTTLDVRSIPAGLSVEARDGGGVGAVRFPEGAVDYVGTRREGQEISIYVRREGSMNVGLVRVDLEGARHGDRFGDRASVRLGVAGLGLLAFALFGLLGLAAAAARHARVVGLASPRPGRALLRGRIASDVAPRWEGGALLLPEGARFIAADRRIALPSRLEVLGAEGAPPPNAELYLLGSFERSDVTYRAGEPSACPEDAVLWVVTPSKEVAREAYRWAVLTSALALPVVAGFVGVFVAVLWRL